MKLVVIESPYSGDLEHNVEYTLQCMHDSYYVRREAPIASHLLYTRLPQCELDGAENYHGHVQDSETSRHGREHGILCGFAWNSKADLVAVYTDHGISRGMEHGIKFAQKNNIEIEYRTILKQTKQSD